MEQKQTNQALLQSKSEQIPPRSWLQNLFDFFESINKTIQNIVNSEGFKLFKAMLIEVGKALLNYANKTAKEADIILFRMGWWILPDWTISDIFNVVSLYNEGKKDEIEKQIMAYFDNKKLNKMLKEWRKKPLLKSRIHILKDAIWAHNKGKYTLSVPTLLPQLEGIMIEGLGLTGKVQYKQLKESFKTRLEIPEDDFISITKTSGYKIIEKFISEKFEWGQSEKSKVGRHTILHGHHRNYNRKKTSLKLILLIDYTQKVLNKEMILRPHINSLQPLTIRNEAVKLAKSQ